MDEFFDRIRALGVVRPDQGRWGAGVAAGLSRRWDVDEVLIRGVFVALAVFGGLGVAAYGLGWLLLPQQDGRIHLQQAIRGHFSAGFLGAALLSLALFGGQSGPWNDGIWFHAGFPGGLLLAIALIGGIWYLARTRDPAAGQVAGPHGRPWHSSSSPTGTFPATGATPGATAPGGPAPSGPATFAPATSATGYGPVTDYGAPGQYGTPGEPRTSSGAGGAPIYGAPGYTGGPGGPAGPGSGGPQFADTPGASPRDLARQRSAPSRTIVRLTLGGALLAAAAILGIGHLSDWSAPVALVASATALAVIAAGVLVSGLNGRRAAGLAGVGVLLAIGTLIGSAADQVGIRAGQNLAIVGSQNWHPRTANAADTQFNLGVGEATVTLTDPAILARATTADPHHISARIGAGHLIVVVPSTVPTQLNIKIGAGEVVHPDGSTQQVGSNGDDQVQTLTTGPAGAPRLIVEIQQGVGQLEIRTASPPSASVPPTPPDLSRTTPSRSAKADQPTPAPTLGSAAATTPTAAAPTAPTAPATR